MSTTLAQLQAMSHEELLAHSIEQAKSATKRKAGELTLKVSAKGGISVYGLGKWPVTLYSSQMTRFLDAADNIRAFMADNADQLAVKPEVEA